MLWGHCVLCAACYDFLMLYVAEAHVEKVIFF